MKFQSEQGLFNQNYDFFWRKDPNKQFQKDRVWWCWILGRNRGVFHPCPSGDRNRFRSEQVILALSLVLAWKSPSQNHLSENSKSESIKNIMKAIGNHWKQPIFVSESKFICPNASGDRKRYATLFGLHLRIVLWSNDPTSSDMIQRTSCVFSSRNCLKESWEGHFRPWRRFAASTRNTWSISGEKLELPELGSRTWIREFVYPYSPTNREF